MYKNIVLNFQALEIKIKIVYILINKNIHIFFILNEFYENCNYKGLGKLINCEYIFCNIFKILCIKCINLY